MDEPPFEAPDAREQRGVRWHIRRVQGGPSIETAQGFDKSFQHPQSVTSLSDVSFRTTNMKFTPDDRKLIVYEKEVIDYPQTLRDRNRSWIVGAASRECKP